MQNGMVRARCVTEIKIGIIGVGNCASSLVQGIHFHEKEDRLYELGHVEIWAQSLNLLRLVGMEFFQFNRRASLDQLLGKAERKHYSTFSLYTREDFRQAMNGFQARIKNHFSDANNIRWSDENIMLVFQRIE